MYPTLQVIKWICSEILRKNGLMGFIRDYFILNASIYINEDISSDLDLNNAPSLNKLSLSTCHLNMIVLIMQHTSLLKLRSSLFFGGQKSHMTFIMAEGIICECVFLAAFFNCICWFG